MSDDLVKLLRRPYGNPTFAEKQEIADRIEELEAKLAKANMKLVAWKAWASGEPSNPPKTGVTPTNIADIKGQDND